MKLRIPGNSLRLRLTRPEIAELLAAGFVEDRLQLGPQAESALVYRLELSDNVTAPRACFEAHCISIQLPVAAGTLWTDSEQVGIYSEEAWGLKLIIEKDFKCLDPRIDEDDSDAFDHPGNADAPRCGVT